MNLLQQFQSLFYSFFFGFISTGIYHVMNRLFYKIPSLMRYVLQIFIGFSFGFCYFLGLVKINNGIMRFYFFVFIFMGYLFYQKYYAYHLLYYLEKIVHVIKRILKPFIFFFRKINVIILKKVKKVKLKWRKNDNPNIKSS